MDTGGSGRILLGLLGSLDGFVLVLVVVLGDLGADEIPAAGPEGAAEQGAEGAVLGDGRSDGRAAHTADHGAGGAGIFLGLLAAAQGEE